MDKDLKEFIRQEQVKLSNIQSGLRQEQRARLIPKINEIRFLLNLLANEGNVISKKDKKDLEKKIDDATKNTQETARKEQIREAINVSLINRIRPNRSEIPEAIRQKAVMAKASGLFDSNNGDIDSVNEFLENEGVDYRVSNRVNSTGEALVLENRLDPTDVKVAFRGSKANNAQDWISNAKMLIGQEKTIFGGEKDAFGEARAKVKEVERVYGNKANEIIGFSRGGGLAMTTGDAEGIDTTVFNPFVAKNLSRAGETTAKHTVWRTTEDLSSMGLGFRYDLKNIDLNVIRPHRDNVGDPFESHRLKNFTEKKPRATEDNPELIENLIKENIHEPVAKHAEAENIHRALSFQQNQGRILESKDPYNARAKAKQESGLLGHNVNDESNYKVGEQMLALPAPEAPADRMIREAEQESIDLDSFFKEFTAEQTGASDGGIRGSGRGLPQTLDKRLKKLDAIDELLRKSGAKMSDEGLGRVIEEEEMRGLVREELKLEEKKPQVSQKKPAAEPKKEATEEVESIDKQLIKTQKEYEARLRKRSSKSISGMKETIVGEDEDKAIEELKDKLMRLRNQRKIQRQAEREPSFKDWVKEVRPNDVGADGKLSSNITGNSKVASIWRKIGGKFTDDEIAHLNANKTPEGDKYKFSLDDDEIADLISEDTKEERHRIVKDYEQDVHDGIKKVDDAISIEDNAGNKRSLTGDLLGGMSAINLGVGFGAAYTADKVLDKIDPNLDPTLKTGITGAVSGGVAESSALALSGAAASIGASGGLILAPAAAAGAVGNIAGMEAYKGLKKLGASDFTAETGAGGAGGLAAGLTAGGLLSAAAAGGIAGAEAAAPADLETLGLASVGAGLLGAGLGAATYVGTKEYGDLKRKIRSSTSATDLEAQLGAGAGTGATIGAGLGLLAGPLGAAAGGVIGGGIGGIAALAKYGIDKLF
tara:strand:+ start:995 stop:3805 length:2811 start_codon:yes stop_codon:yes gene_type:complete